MRTIQLRRKIESLDSKHRFTASFLSVKEGSGKRGSGVVRSSQCPPVYLVWDVWRQSTAVKSLCLFAFWNRRPLAQCIFYIYIFFIPGLEWCLQLNQHRQKSSSSSSSTGRHRHQILLSFSRPTSKYVSDQVTGPGILYWRTPLRESALQFREKNALLHQPVVLHCKVINSGRKMPCCIDR